MTFDEILNIAGEVFLFAIGVYILAGFIVSFKQILPFLAIAVSIAAIILFLNIQIQEYTTIKFVILIVLLLMGQLFYQGDGYMNPVVHENMYTLVNVERKWNSWFAEYDDYELHFSPVETGGFFVNTFMYGLAFGAFYVYLCIDGLIWLGLMIPIYVICMSILDMIYMCGVSISGIAHWILHAIVVIIALSVGLIGNTRDKYESIQTKSMYKKCAEYAVLDYNRSYKIEYEHCKEDENGVNQAVEKIYFMHDADINVSAFFTPNTKNSAVYKDKNNVYNTIYLKEENYNGNMVKFTNRSNVSGDPDFKFDSYATAVGGPYKYVDMHKELEEYCVFTESKFMNAYQIDRNKSEKRITVRYKEYLGTNKYKFVTYSFETNKKEEPISLISIFCSFEIDGETQYFKYIPLSGETDLAERTYDNGTRLHGYIYQPGGSDGNLDNEEYNINVSELLYELRQIEDVASGYDFVFEMNNGSQTLMYVYDADTNIVALYESYNLNNGYDAVSNNDFITYRPDYYIYNEEMLMVEAISFVPTNLGNPIFEKYTCDYAGASKFIMYAFYDFVASDVEFSENEQNQVEAYFTADNVSVLNIDMTYVVTYKSDMGLYNPHTIKAIGSKAGYTYELTMYYRDTIDFQM